MKDHPGVDCNGNPVTCHYCQKKGHREYECYTKANREAAAQGKQTNGQARGYNGNQANKASTSTDGNRNGNGTGNGQQSKPNALGKLNAMSRSEAEANNDVITGTFSISSIPIKVLFDSGATYSFVSTKILQKLLPVLKTVDTIDIPIVIPSGKVVQCTKRYIGVPMVIEGVEFEANLIEFDLGDLDVILGMDWLSKNRAEIKCDDHKISFMRKGKKVSYWKFGKPKVTKVVTMMRFASYVRKGYPMYFSSVRDLEIEESSKPEDIEVVKEFLDVFPEEIPGMPPQRTIDFTIDLVPGTAPISKAPYRMAPAEMSELKDQLEDLLKKGYIRPSASPWGAPVLFVKKKEVLVCVSITENGISSLLRTSTRCRGLMIYSIN